MKENDCFVEVSILQQATYVLIFISLEGFTSWFMQFLMLKKRMYVILSERDVIFLLFFVQNVVKKASN